MSQLLTIYILEDDSVFREEFREFLKAYFSEHSIGDYRIMEYASATEMLRENDTVPDLIFSDIQLEDEEETGISCSMKMRERFPKCEIVFMTAFLEFATEIYECEPLYFILKSDFRERLPNAMELFARRFAEKQTCINVISENRPVTIMLEKLLYCEHSGRATILHSTDGDYVVRMTIAELFAQLPARRFAISHKGFIVNLVHVRSYTRRQIMLDNGVTVPISRSRCDEFRENYCHWLSR